MRGPRAALYGSEAIGGVIQIFTRKGKGPARARAMLGAGSHNTSEVSTGVSGGTDTNWFNVSLDRFRTSGINAREPTPLLNEPDDDGYQNNAFSARYGHRFANGMELEVYALQADGNTEFDASFGGNEDEFTQQVAGTKLRISATSDWNVLLEAGRSLDERRTFRVGAPGESRFDSEIQSFLWQNDLTFGADHVVTAGTDFRNDQVDSTTAFSVTSRRDEAVFAQYQGKFGEHDFLIALRANDNEQFGGETTGNTAWGYDISSLMRLIVSFGTAFRAPTFNELFFPGFSNPDLEPETAESLEVGLRGKHAYGNWDVRAYRTEVDDLIVSPPPLFIPQNVDEATIEGIEAEISANIGTWKGRAALSYVDPRDEATNNILARRARRTAKLQLQRRFRRTEIALSIIAQSRRFDDPANTIEVDGYGIVNLAINHELSKDLRLSGRINNLFDKEYQTIDTFNELKRNVFVALAYQP